MENQKDRKNAKLGDIAEVKTGPFGSQLHQSDYVKEGIPILTVEHFGDNKVIHRNLPLVGKEDYQRLKRFKLEHGDIVFSRVGSVDRRVYITEDEEGWLFSGRCLRIRLKGKDNNSKYLSYFLSTPHCLYEIKSKAVGATMPSLNTSILKSINILLPAKEEQEKIADILSTWDKVIELKEQLIEQKKLQKKGLMQKLLTGDLRLSTFTEEWKKVSLGELGELKTSPVNKKNNPKEFPIFLVNYMDVYKNGIIDETINYMQVTATEKQIRTFKVNYGDVLFTPSSETPNDIGHSAVVKVDKECLLFSYHLIRLQFYDDMNINFKAYVFNSPTLLKDFARKSTGSTRYTLSLKDFKESEVKVPSDCEEQKAIGEFLLTIDKEIELRQREVKKLKQQKKGLMQQLLTGEMRVNV